jgi:LmbE family N-acetylglucosaminyl deacetylase
MSTIPNPSRVLAIGAHPDDIEFGCGGSLARWAASGAEIVMAVVTDGSKGTWDPTQKPADLIAARAAEQHQAADVLGATEVVMIGHRDGELVYSPQLRTEMCRLIRTHRPEVLITHDPWRPYEIHPDHRAVGEAVVDGMVSARDPLFEVDMGIEPHRPHQMLLWRPQAADHWEDIGAFWETKVDALLCHASQAQTTMDDAHLGDDHRSVFEDRLRKHAAQQGEAAGLELAESFKLIIP